MYVIARERKSANMRVRWPDVDQRGSRAHKCGLHRWFQVRRASAVHRCSQICQGKLYSCGICSIISLLYVTYNRIFHLFGPWWLPYSRSWFLRRNRNHQKGLPTYCSSTSFVSDVYFCTVCNSLYLASVHVGASGTWDRLFGSPPFRVVCVPPSSSLALACGEVVSGLESLREYISWSTRSRKGVHYPPGQA